MKLKRGGLCKPKHSVSRLFQQPRDKRRLDNYRDAEIKLEANNIQFNSGLLHPTLTKNPPTLINDLTDWKAVEDSLSESHDPSRLTKDERYKLLKGRIPWFENQTQFHRENKALCAYLDY